MREKLIDLITDIENELTRAYPYTTDEFRINAIADHLIANGVTFATDKNDGHKWIPVTERLPEKDGDYLVWTGFQGRCERLGFVKDGREISELDFQYNWKNVWYDYDSEWGYISHDVTHWMPLPEPPKEVTT